VRCAARAADALLVGVARAEARALQRLWRTSPRPRRPIAWIARSVYQERCRSRRVWPQRLRESAEPSSLRLARSIRCITTKTAIHPIVLRTAKVSNTVDLHERRLDILNRNYFQYYRSPPASLSICPFGGVIGSGDSWREACERVFAVTQGSSGSSRPDSGSQDIADAASAASCTRPRRSRRAGPAATSRSRRRSPRHVPLP